MAQGRRSEWRMMLLLQAGAIDRLFGNRPLSEAQIDRYLRTGNPGNEAQATAVREPQNPLVDEIVARTLATGKLIVE